VVFAFCGSFHSLLTQLFQLPRLFALSFEGSSTRLRALHAMALFEGTWVAPSLGGEIVKMRWLLLACISCGLIQKPLISFAWDVQVFVKTLADVHKANASRQLLGGTAILLRQVFAATAQDVVGRRALDLAARGGRWTCRSLEALLRELQRLDPADASKRRGRMSQFSGPPWLSNLLSDSSHLEQFSAAADAVGNLLDAPVLAGGSKLFSAVCTELKGPAKLPLLGAYSVPHLMRACVVARRVIDGTVIDVSGDTWLQDLRPMHRERTAGVFDTLGVHSLDDALVMQRSVMGVVKTFYSTRTVAKYSGMSLVDLPCQACELVGVLNFLEKHLSTHACGVGVIQPDGSWNDSPATTPASRPCPSSSKSPVNVWRAKAMASTSSVPPRWPSRGSGWTQSLWLRSRSGDAPVLAGPASLSHCLG